MIGRYWLAHHTFISPLARMDRALIALNLVYLAFIAFLPFPTALLGEYFENPLSIADLCGQRRGWSAAWRSSSSATPTDRDLLQRKLPPDVYRYGVAMSLSPVLFFLLSIPVAFVSTTLAVCCWFLGIPLAAVAERWKPEGADELLRRLGRASRRRSGSRPASFAA